MKLSWLMAVLALAVRASGESCQDLRDAASGGRTEEVQRLLRNGVHVDCRAGWDDRTALGAAAGNNELETAELLLQHGATVDAKSKYGEMPLHEAASNGHEQMAKVLVSHGADVDAKNEWGWTPLRDAARYGHLQAADDLLQKAARYGYKQVAKVLISHGADVNAKDEDGDTPLHSAASQGHEQVAKLLISHGADVDAKDEDGDTPLHTAASSGHEQVAKLLVKHGGRVEDAFHERVPIKLLARLVGKGSIRLDKVFRCDEDLMIAFPQEKLQMGAHLTTDCIRSMSKPVAKFWFEHGGNPWMSTPDELRYVYLIKDTEVRKCHPPVALAWRCNPTSALGPISIVALSRKCRTSLRTWKAWSWGLSWHREGVNKARYTTDFMCIFVRENMVSHRCSTAELGKLRD
eukprot:s49_g83.t1